MWKSSDGPSLSTTGPEKTSGSYRSLPPGSACAIALMRSPDAAGPVQGLHLVVNDIDAARSELVGRGVEVSELFHFEEGAQLPGADAERRDYNTFFSFTDPDGTGWMVQEVSRRKGPCPISEQPQMPRWDLMTTRPLLRLPTRPRPVSARAPPSVPRRPALPSAAVRARESRLSYALARSIPPNVLQ